MLARMEFCLLGPLVVRRDGADLPVPTGKQRIVLAALLLRAGRVVPAGDLAGLLWGSDPPPSAGVTMRNHVRRLRQALGAAGQSRIRTQPGGYLISVGASELDVSQFETLSSSARAALRDGAWDQAAARASQALTLWRGEPLADAGCEILAQRELPWLAELRLQTIEALAEARLRLGEHTAVVAELRRLIAAHPLREHLHGLLMRALQQSGRQAEALAAFQEARRVLVTELGSEPGAGLRDLHQQILTSGPARQPARPDDGRQNLVRPQSLPGAVRHFTGRDRELAALDELSGQTARDGPKEPATMVISAIGGMAGVGKTALAVHWAHRVAEAFPDGQLYLNLRGYDPAEPVPAAEALVGLLRMLGVPDPDIPAGEQERAARYRSLLAGRRMLVVLDNAGSAQQVRPLLPGSPACVVVVTSRDSLAGLVARDGAQPLELDLLPPPDAARLLCALIGERAAASPAAASVLADRCGRLPLALRVAAELAATRPAVPLARLARELADQHQRLDLLEAGGDMQTAVRAVFHWSYRHLGPAAARAFRLLGLHPGPDLDGDAAAALTGTSHDQAGRLLGQLTRAHLIQATGPDSYELHDLLRAYAAELTASNDLEPERRAALNRLLDHYLQAAAAAMDVLYPAERDRRPRVPPPAYPGPIPAGPEQARDWLDRQRDRLVAATAHASVCGLPEHATRLAAVLFRYLETGGHARASVTVHSHALRAARQSTDRVAEANALLHLGIVWWGKGQHQRASACLSRALVVFRRTGDRLGEARAVANLGLVDLEQGRHQQAARQLRRAGTLYRQTGDRLGAARVLTDLGRLDADQGRYLQAARQYQQALALFRTAGDTGGEARLLGNLGFVQMLQGDLAAAGDLQQRSLALCRATGYRIGEAYALHNLGIICLRQSRCQSAIEQLTGAVALHKDTGCRRGEASACNDLGEAFLVEGRPGNARGQYDTALWISSQTGDQFEQARAHQGLGQVCHLLRDHSQAEEHWREALTRYTRLGAPEAGQVRTRLASADG